MRNLRLRIAPFSGFIALVSSLLSLILELGDHSYFQGPFILSTSISLVSYFVFMSAFIELGRKAKSSLLIISSILIIVISSIDDILACLSVTSDLWRFVKDEPLTTILLIESLGLSTLLHGYSQIQSQKNLGKFSRETGWIEICVGICSITFILLPLGLILVLPMYAFQILQLYYASKKYAERQR